MQRIEHTLRALDRLAHDEKDQIERQEKALADYQAQLNRTFEHEEKLKELLTRQAQLSAALDLDKGERQIAPDSEGADVNEPRTISPTGGPHAAAITASARFSTALFRRRRGRIGIHKERRQREESRNR